MSQHNTQRRGVVSTCTVCCCTFWSVTCTRLIMALTDLDVVYVTKCYPRQDSHIGCNAHGTKESMAYLCARLSHVSRADILSIFPTPPLSLYSSLPPSRYYTCTTSSPSSHMPALLEADTDKLNVWSYSTTLKFASLCCMLLGDVVIKHSTSRSCSLTLST